MSTQYLVTGAAGNLGFNLISELLKRGKKVRALVLANDRLAKRLPKDVEIVEGDILNKPDLDSFFRHGKTDDITVIHAAGIVSIDPGYNKKVHDVNVSGTQNIVEQSLDHEVKKLIYVSSVHAIPELPKGQVMSEVSDFEPEKVVGCYGRSKAEASQIVLDASREHGLNASIVQPSGIIGPRDYGVSNITRLLIDIATKRLAAGIDGGYNFVDVRDVATGIVNCADAGKKGECYILGNRYVSVKELIDITQKTLSLKRIVPMLPVWIARALVPFFGLYYKIKNQKPLFTSYSLHTLTTNSDFSIDKAKTELGFSPRPFEQTIQDAVNWLKQAGLI